MRKSIWGPLLALALLLSACGERETDVSKYRVNIAPADSMGEWVTAWLEGMESGDGFQSFIYSDPDSWDLYLYYPAKQAQVRALTAESVRLELIDSVLQVYVTPSGPGEPETPGSSSAAWVIHIAAPFRGPWPTGAALYWGVACDSVYYNM